MRAVRALLLLGAGFVLAGCSQLAAVAPVGGDRVSNVRYAALDVLVDEGVEILTAPDCVERDRSVTCTGSTLDGQAIAVTSTAAEEDRIEIVVGRTTLFAGSVSAVIDGAIDGAAE